VADTVGVRGDLLPMVCVMKENDLVRVRSHTVEEYALLIEIGHQDGHNWVRVRYFDGEEEVLHPTQIRRVHVNKR